MEYSTRVSENTIPKLIYGDGDGVVNLRSLEGCLRWRSTQKQEVHYQQFPSVNHAETVSDKQILYYLKNLLNIQNMKKSTI